MASKDHNVIKNTFGQPSLWPFKMSLISLFVVCRISLMYSSEKGTNTKLPMPLKMIKSTEI